jgi:predicted enzyme related to lactoylglutathione lyase
MSTAFANIVVPVDDIERAKALYRTLFDVEPYVDEPYYVGFRVGEQELGLDPNGHREGAVGYWEVDDIEQRVAALRDAGAAEVQGIHDVGGGKRVATLKDADGNLIGLSETPS